MIVVDTNVLCCLYLTSEYSEQAESALRRDPLWAAPALWRSEFRNVLRLYLRKELLKLDEAVQVMEQAEAFMSGREYHVASLLVLRLVAASDLSAYDCEFVALAQDLDVTLVTADRQIVAAFPETSMLLETFAAER